MENLAKVVLIIGVVGLIMGVIAKFMGPVMGSLPGAIINFASSCFLLSIALTLLGKK